MDGSVGEEGKEWLDWLLAGWLSCMTEWLEIQGSLGRRLQMPTRYEYPPKYEVFELVADMPLPLMSTRTRGLNPRMRGS